MKVELTKSQIEAIQKMLYAHSGAGGTIPNANVCHRAFVRINEQTGIIHVTDKDIERGRRWEKKLLKQKDKR